MSAPFSDVSHDVYDDLSRPHTPTSNGPTSDNSFSTARPKGIFSSFSREVRQIQGEIGSDTSLVVSIAQTINRAIQFEKITLIFTHLLRLGHGVGNSFKEPLLWQKVVAVFPCVGSLIGMGFGVYLAITSATEIYYEGKKKEEDVKSAGLCFNRKDVLKDAVLYLVHSIAWICDSIASFTLGLSQIRLIVSSTIPLWAPFLSIAATCLSPILMLWNWRGIGHSKMLLQRLDNDLVLLKEEMLKSEEAPRPLQWLFIELRNTAVGDGPYFLGRHFSILNREKYYEQIIHLINTLDKQPGNQNVREKATKLVSALKHRLTDKIMCHKLTIVSTFVATIGTIVLFLEGPLFLSIGLLLIASLIGCITTWKEGNSVKNLQITIDEVSPLIEARASPETQQLLPFTPCKILPEKIKLR
jgi:hypothetical protein